jgi:hypothetical protein
MNDVAAYHVFVYALFPVQVGMRTAVHIHVPLCAGNNARTNTSFVRKVLRLSL